MEPQVLETLILIVHVLASLAIIGLVLIQHGKGADMGSGFGGGSSGTVFGSGGAGNFLTKATTGLAVAFFVTSFTLAYFAKQKSITVRNIGVPEAVLQVPVETEVELPALNAGSTDSDLPQAEDDMNTGESEIPEG
jgi:preprotein translocase subunit SecG